MERVLTITNNNGYETSNNNNPSLLFFLFLLLYRDKNIDKNTKYRIPRHSFPISTYEFY